MLLYWGAVPLSLLMGNHHLRSWILLMVLKVKSLLLQGILNAISADGFVAFVILRKHTELSVYALYGFLVWMVGREERKVVHAGDAKNGERWS